MTEQSESEEKDKLRQIGAVLRYLKRKKIYYRMQEDNIVIPYYKER